MKFQLYYCTNSAGSTRHVLAGCEDAAKEVLLKTEFFRYTSDCGISHRCSIVETSGSYRLPALRDQINAGQIKAPEGGWPDALVINEWNPYNKDYTSSMTLHSPDTGRLELYVIPPYDEFQKIVEALRTAEDAIRTKDRSIAETDKFRASLKSFLEV